MYTNPHNIILTMIQTLNIQADIINDVVGQWNEGKKLTIFEGLRPTLPLNAYPSLEIEPEGASNEWVTTRAQRPRYNFELTLTTHNTSNKFDIEYPAEIYTLISEILSNPSNLQLPILNECKWELNGGLVQTFMLDANVENVTYNSNREGTMRQAKFSYYVLVHETYPDSMFPLQAGISDPNIIRPKTITVP